ncbi:MAG: peptide chain release factor N(5)-glutamine methyltransferase [Puniceicoccales bacterium]|jgi:release factor glutamine methyltransferase|nr:peptide chain release factor N(5)-glutamine methyltransferase [Puniceicoccales bacterium]
MPSLIEILKQSEDFLKSKGVVTAKLDAELLLSHLLRCNRLSLHLHPYDNRDRHLLSQFQHMVSRRGNREPLQYIIGEVDFYGLSIAVDRNVLIPRHETEELVDIIISRFGNRPMGSILDLGTGSGAIGLALAKHFPKANVLAIDADQNALSMAQKNAMRNRIANIEFMVSDWLESIDGAFDMIISNPPYLTDEEFENAQDEIKKFEPKCALVSKNDGLADIFKIIGTAGRFLTKDGMLALETGSSQHEPIASFAKDYFDRLEFICDLGGKNRFIFFQNSTKFSFPSDINDPTLPLSFN